eukprot:COSAG01_NODE_636_length_14635_cov_18.612617_6_plen_363_part_00
MTIKAIPLSSCCLNILIIGHIYKHGGTGFMFTRSLTKTQPASGLELLKRTIPQPQADETLIRVLKTGICGTDLHLYNYDDWAASIMQIPQVIGHEFVGKIMETGQITCAEAHSFCDNCMSCKQDMRHLCLNSQGLGVHRDGAMTDYLCLPTKNLFLMPGIPLDIAAFADALGNAVYAVQEAQVTGKSVLITGAGPIGLSVLMLCKFLKAKDVCIADPIAYRVKLAEQLAADEGIILSDQNCHDGFKLASDYQADIGFELSGNASAFQSLLAHLNPGGKALVLGLIPNHSALNWPDIIFKSIQIHCLYGRKIFKTWQHLHDLLMQGFDPSPIITHHFLAKDFDQAFQLMQSKQCGKVILDWKS